MSKNAEQPDDSVFLLPKKVSDHVLQEVGEELLVYDHKQGKTHLLSATAAAVYRFCDGKTPATEVPGIPQDSGDEPLEAALTQLQNAGLVEGKSSRRNFLASLGKVAALPLVASVMLPQAAAAQSGCEMGGFTGCNGAGIPGNIGGPPTGCQPCCGANSSPTGGACDTCTSGCSICSCVRSHICRDAMGSVVSCALAGSLSICDMGTNDTASPASTCGLIGFTIGMFAVRQSCDTARADVAALGGTTYSCCECP